MAENVCRRQECLKHDIRVIFLKACENNDLDKVKMCHGLGVDSNMMYTTRGEGLLRGLPGRLTGLIAAATGRQNVYQNGNLEVLEWLLSQPGINVNLASRNDSALTAACAAGNGNAVRRLLQAPGININWQNSDGLTAAHCAAFYPHGAACVELLSSLPEVDWNKKNINGETPLFYALRYGHPESVDIILNTPGVYLQFRDRRGNTLAHCCSHSAMYDFERSAYASRDTLRLKLLLSKREAVPWNEKNNDGDTPLMMAMKNEKIDVAKVFLECCWVDPSIADNEGRTPEMFARYRYLVYCIVHFCFIYVIGC